MKRKINPVLAAILAISLLMLSCGMSLDTGAATPVPSETPTETATPTVTPKPTNTPRPTATPNVVATQKVQSMMDLAAKFVNDGYIDSPAGEYISLPNFTESWAQLGWYQWYEDTSQVLADFIVKVDLEWETAYATSDPSGCGIVFRRQDNGEHYLLFVSVDGYMYSFVNTTTYMDIMGRAFWGPKAPTGRASLTMLATADTFRVFINDTLVKTLYGMKTNMLKGRFSYTIVSGTNKDYGTRCTFTNGAIWSLK